MEYKDFFKDLFTENYSVLYPSRILPGGVGDNTKITDIDTLELSKGTTVEMEHTSDERIAKAIAIDHLTEDPEYYIKLKKAELAPELDTFASTTGLGDSEHPLNKPHRIGFEITPTAGNNVFKMKKTPGVTGNDGKLLDTTLSEDSWGHHPEKDKLSKGRWTIDPYDTDNSNNNLHGTPKLKEIMSTSTHQNIGMMELMKFYEPGISTDEEKQQLSDLMDSQQWLEAMALVSKVTNMPMDLSLFTNN